MNETGNSSVVSPKWMPALSDLRFASSTAPSNRAFIQQEIPHIGKLMCDSIGAVLEQSELLVIGNRGEEFKDALAQLREDQIVLDLVRIGDAPPDNPNYGGICW